MGVWVCHLQELLKFERLHGHCNVPQKYSQNPSLGAWVAQQRRRYKHGTLSPKRIMLMEQAGIEWALRRGPPPLPSYLLFSTSCDRLVQGPWLAVAGGLEEPSLLGGGFFSPLPLIYHPKSYRNSYIIDSNVRNSICFENF